MNMMQTKKSRLKLSSKLSDGFDISLRFNALRFLAFNLKQQNDEIKEEKALAEQ
jgi:hypothetical protein